MTTYEYIVRKRDEEERKSSEKDFKQETSTSASKPIKVQWLFVYLSVLGCSLLMVTIGHPGSRCG